jgi:hypothetical protein
MFICGTVECTLMKLGVAGLQLKLSGEFNFGSIPPNTTHTLREAKIGNNFLKKGPSFR